MDLTGNYSRIAIRIEDRDSKATWFNVGHGIKYDDHSYRVIDRENSGVFLWWFLDGKFIVKGPYGVKDSIGNHEAALNLSARKLDYIYSGRYDVEQKIVSIQVPRRFKFRDIPEIIVSQLERAFPEAERFIRFND